MDDKGKTRKELIAATHEVDEIRKHITADSLQYISHEGLFDVIPNPEKYCSACFDDNYPILLKQDNVEQIDLFK